MHPPEGSELKAGELHRYPILISGTHDGLIDLGTLVSYTLPLEAPFGSIDIQGERLS
jgi:hypothetical protein